MDREEILLREYETCQSDINITSSHYWTIVGVFIAISTALLGAVPYVILQSRILETVFKYNATRSEMLQIFVLGLVVLVLGVGMIKVLVFLKRYHRRTAWVVLAAHERMRHIEDALGMYRGWIMYGLDRVCKKGESNEYDFKDEVSKEEKDKLVGYRPMEWWKWMRTRDEYSKPEGAKNVQRIFCTFIGLWGLFVVCALVGVARGIILWRQ